MSRSPTHVPIGDAPGAGRPLLEVARSKVGSVLNRWRLTARSPAALDGGRVRRLTPPPPPAWAPANTGGARC